MRDLLRAMIIPFFMSFIPAVWYINRNVLTEQLPPYIEPTTELLVTLIGVAVFASILFAAVFALFSRQTGENDLHESPYHVRIFNPDDTALLFFFSFMSIITVWALIEVGDLGLVWVGELLQILLAPLALPLVVFAPLAIQFHWAVVLSLVFCVLWMSFLGIVLSDTINGRSVPLVNK